MYVRGCGSCDSGQAQVGIIGVDGWCLREVNTVQATPARPPPASRDCRRTRPNLYSSKTPDGPTGRQAGEWLVAVFAASTAYGRVKLIKKYIQ